MSPAQQPDASPLARALRDVEARLNAGDTAGAARPADAALRLAPVSVEVNRVYARVARLNGWFQAALDALARAADGRPGPEIEAEAIRVLIAAEDLDAATDRLAEALVAHALEPGGSLEAAGRETLSAAQDAGRDVLGFAGVAPDLSVYGVWTGAALPPLAANFTASIARLESGAFRAESAEGHATLIGGSEPQLIGGAGRWPPKFAVDGRCRAVEDGLEGWVSLSWRDAAELEISLETPAGDSVRIVQTSPPDGRGRRGFKISGLGGPGGPDRLEVKVRTPDGALRALPVSPVFLRLPDAPTPAAAPAARVRRSGSRLRAKPRPDVDVIIPVYLGLDETLACVASVLASLPEGAHAVIVDDASPDPELVSALDALEAAGAVTLWRNPRNLGFPGAVNEGLALHPKRDVVILNADVEVYPGWLERLSEVAYSARDIGTVTALTNEGSIASYPGGGADCPPDAARSVDEMCARLAPGAAIDAPSAVGHCMFVRRACLDATGALDAALFARGYGEENDFSLRALAKGWRSVITPSVFVRHAGGRSFGASKAALLERNLELLNRRHPGYDARVQEWIAADPLRSYRRRLDIERLSWIGRPAHILVAPLIEGGVARSVAERAEQVALDGTLPVIVRAERGSGLIRVETPTQPELRDLEFAADEMDALVDWLAGLAPVALEIHHFLNFPPDLLDRILRIGAPVDVFLHDYAWICPRVTLLTPDVRYCGEPDLPACEACAIGPGRVHEPELSVSALRARSRDWLGLARSVRAPSQDAATRLGRYFPEIRVEAWPLERAEVSRRVRPPETRPLARVALIGAIGQHKGFDVLAACAEDALARGLPLEFVIVGFSEDDARLSTFPNVFVTGRYAEGEAEALLLREAPDVAFFPSIWPETWCYALTHALEAELPVVAFDMGAVAERLSAIGAPHRLLPVSTPASRINDQLLAAVGRSAGRAADTSLHAKAPAIVPQASSEPPTQIPAVTLFKELDAILGSRAEALPERHMEKQKSSLSVSAEIITLNRGVYQISVAAGAPKRVGEEGEIVLPAMHVGPAPGVSEESIEVMTGLRNSGAWLYEPRDLMILKAKANPTHLLMTSVRTEGMAPLEITVERLDNRKRGGDAPQGRAPVPALAAPAPASAEVAPARPRSLPQTPAPREDALPLEISAHVRNRGDMVFREAYWAGAVGEGLPIEAYAIRSDAAPSPDAFEYKALDGRGRETPWVTAGTSCGNRGEGVPLLGFAVRMRAEHADAYDCEYRGAFQSGRIVGPLTNGAPCRSPESNDPLEAIQVSITPRRKGLKLTAAEDDGRSPPVEPQIGPRFSVFREEA